MRNKVFKKMEKGTRCLKVMTESFPVTHFFYVVVEMTGLLYIWKLKTTHCIFLVCKSNSGNFFSFFNGIKINGHKPFIYTEIFTK